MRFGTMFSGGGLADVGLRAAGLDHAWGIELDPARVAVARVNGLDVMCADVLAVDAQSLARVDWLHASPPCTEYSQAKPSAVQEDGTRGTDLDYTLALRVADFARELRPAWVSVENVEGWEGTPPQVDLRAALERIGYTVRVWHINAADFGVPQNRERVFMVAALGREPVRPSSTHRRGGDLMIRPWVGWDSACPDWRDIEARPLTDRMAATLAYAGGGVAAVNDSRQTGPRLLVNSNTKNHREKSVRDILVLGGYYNPIRAGSWRLPIHRIEGLPAPTITQNSCLQVVTHDGARTLTARHVARIAGLPDSWHLPATLTMTREVCGLGVCPPVMTAIVAAQGL